MKVNIFNMIIECYMHVSWILCYTFIQGRSISTSEFTSFIQLAESESYCSNLLLILTCSCTE